MGQSVKITGRKQPVKITGRGPGRPRKEAVGVKVSPVSKARISESTARARKELALAELREMEVREKKRELVEAAAVIQLWAANATTIASAIGNLPETAAPDLALCGGDARKIRDTLRTHVERMQRDLAAQLSDGVSASASDTCG